MRSDSSGGSDSGHKMRSGDSWTGYWYKKNTKTVFGSGTDSDMMSFAERTIHGGEAAYDVAKEMARAIRKRK